MAAQPKYVRDWEAAGKPRRGTAYYEYRKASNLAKGRSVSQARGHPRRGEASVSFLRRMRREGVYSSIQVVSRDGKVSQYIVTVYGPEEPLSAVLNVPPDDFTQGRRQLKALTDEMDRIGIAYDVGTP